GCREVCISIQKCQHCPHVGCDHPASFCYPPDRKSVPPDKRMLLCQIGSHDCPCCMCLCLNAALQKRSDPAALVFNPGKVKISADHPGAGDPHVFRIDAKLMAGYLPHAYRVIVTLPSGICIGTS